MGKIYIKRSDLPNYPKPEIVLMLWPDTNPARIHAMMNASDLRRGRKIWARTRGRKLVRMETVPFAVGLDISKLPITELVQQKIKLVGSFAVLFVNIDKNQFVLWVDSPHGLPARWMGWEFAIDRLGDLYEEIENPGVSMELVGYFLRSLEIFNSPAFKGCQLPIQGYAYLNAEPRPIPGHPSGEWGVTGDQHFPYVVLWGYP